MRKLVNCALVIICLGSALFVTSCKKGEVIVLATMTTPGKPIVDFIKTEYEEKGYTLDIQVFEEFSLGNPALVSKAADANLFQHTPYLNDFLEKNKNAKLSVAAELYYPIFGGYSYTRTTIEEITDGDRITIPNDNTNRNRALKVLETAGIITIPENMINATLNDITKLKQVTIEEVDSSLIAVAVKNKTTDLGIVSNTFATLGGLTGEKQIVMESLEKQKTNVNVLAVRTEDLEKQWLIDLVAVLTSDETKKFIEDYFNGTILPLFESKLK